MTGRSGNRIRRIEGKLLISEPEYCFNHSDTFTKLRCSKCNKLVCHRCLVHAPVGIRCLDCGRAPRLPTYDVSRLYLARASLASLLIGIAGGLILSLVLRPFLYGIVYIGVMVGFGYVLAEGISLATNRKRGRSLQFVAFGGVGVALLIVMYIVISIDLFALVGAGAAFYVAFVRLR